MDFPEAEKWISHAAQRPVSDDDLSSQTKTTDGSSPDPVQKPQDVVVLEPVLASQVSKGLQPAMSSDLTHVITSASTWTQDPRFEVDFEQGDPQNPRNLPLWYKSLIIFTISFGTLVVVLYSTSYTTGIGQMKAEFHVSSEPVVTLGVTTYLLGLATGSLVLAPISETYGRKPVYIVAMVFFIIFLIPAATSHSMAEIIVVRFLGAVGGSAMIANSPGTLGDIIGDEYRAFAFSIWSIGPLNGPVIGPVIGGFVTEYLGWRWMNWVVLILAGVAFVLICFMKETYAPALLQQKAAKLRKVNDDERYWSRYDMRLPFLQLMKVNLSRPFVMAINEPICIFWNTYVSIIYGILYLCFVAYPIVFSEIRGWSVGFGGLAFLGIGIGSMLSIAMEPLIRRMINSHVPEPGTDRPPPEASMSVVCIAACLVPIGELWFAWTCVPKHIHWAAPIAAGIPFGAGNTAIFIYASNYLVHSYGIFAASALAGNSVIRSLLGGTLPLAGPALYSALGANWAGTLLGLLEVLIIPIPFVFYRYGAIIRRRSNLIRSLREDQEKAESKQARAKARLAAKGIGDGGGDDEKGLSEKERETMRAEAQLTQVEGLEKEYEV